MINWDIGYKIANNNGCLAPKPEFPMEVGFDLELLG